jgi:hypothetical protein
MSTRTIKTSDDHSGPKIVTLKSIAAVAATLGNVVLMQAYGGLGATFIGIGELIGTNVAVMWFAASALCLLMTALVCVMIVLKVILAGIDALLGDEGKTNAKG